MATLVVDAFVDLYLCNITEMKPDVRLKEDDALIADGFCCCREDGRKQEMQQRAGRNDERRMRPTWERLRQGDGRIL